VGWEKTTHMETPEPLGETCYVCGGGTRGGFVNFESVMKDGTPIIGIDTTPDRDFNVCDSCNIVVHFRCSMHPELGYCDPCYAEIYESKETSGSSSQSQ
jgi:hypothetical protein